MATAPGPASEAAATIVAAPASGRSSGLAVALVIVILILGEVVGAGLYAFSQHAWPFNTPASQPAASATATPTTAPSTSAAPAVTPTAYHFHDSLQSNTNGWMDIPTDCFFGQGGYYVNNGNECPAPTQSIGDGAVSVDVTLAEAVDGSAVAGLVFRWSQDQNGFDDAYALVVGRDGQWELQKFLDGTTTTLVNLSNSPAFKQGIDVTNTISVQMTGSHFVFIVNGTQIGTVDDATMAQGGFALEAVPGAEAIFSNFDVQSAAS